MVSSRFDLSRMLAAMAGILKLPYSSDKWYAEIIHTLLDSNPAIATLLPTLRHCRFHLSYWSPDLPIELQSWWHD
jgi:hypothetical protein